MRFILVLFIFSISTNSLLSQKNLVFHKEQVSSKYAKKEAKKGSTMFYVYQESCSYCHDFTANLESLKKEKKWLQKNMTLIAKDAEYIANSSFLSTYNIRSTPSIIWINHTTNEHFKYEGASDVHAFFMAILKSRNDKKYNSFYKQTYPKNHCEIDTFARSVSLHYLLAKDTVEAISNMKKCQTKHIENQIISEVYLENISYTNPSIIDSEGYYLFEKLALFSQFEYFHSYYNVLKEFNIRSFQITRQQGDTANYNKCIEFEYVLNKDKTDSTYLSRMSYYFLEKKDIKEVKRFIIPLSNKYTKNSELQLKLSKDLFESHPELMNEIMLMASRAVLHTPNEENISWYKKLLVHYGFTEESLDIQP